MSKIADHVTPGQLIASSLMNLILDKLGSMDDRLTALEGGSTTTTGAVVITGINPSGPVQVGQTLTVNGLNFGFSIGAQQVFIDDVQINAFQAGSSDQTLVFLVPTTITNVPAEGRSATLSVGNGVGSPARRTIFLLPAFVLTGGVDVNYVGVTTGAITPNAPATFQYAIKSQASLNASFIIAPVVTGAANATQFNTNLQVLDDSGTVIPSKTIQLFAGQQKTFFVSINPVPAGSTGSFDLSVAASAGGISGGSGAQSMTIGAVPPDPDHSITLNFQAALFLPAANGSATQTGIQMKAGTQGKITLQSVFTAAGTYDITAVVTSGSNWSAGLFTQTTSSPVTISAADLNNPSRAANRLLDFLVAPAAGASASGKVEFRVKNQAITPLRAYSMTVTLAP